MHQYTPSYLAAINWLIGMGTGGTRDGREWCRDTLAQALRDVRRMHGRKRAIRERNHMRQIAGDFPRKGNTE